MAAEWLGGIEAAKLGHDVIMTPNTYVYFDYYQTADTKDEPDAIGGCITLERVYSMEPVPEDLNAEEKKHIIGAQANLWCEYIPTNKTGRIHGTPTYGCFGRSSMDTSRKEGL